MAKCTKNTVGRLAFQDGFGWIDARRYGPSGDRFFQFEIEGHSSPILKPDQIRKLAAWLEKTADWMEKDVRYQS